MKTFVILLALSNAAHAGHVCSETSEVLGRRHCAGFGTWGTLAQLPALAFDVEVFHESFATTPLAAMPAAVFATTAHSAPPATAAGVRLRVGAPLQLHPLYLAFELDIGELSSQTTALLSQAVAALGARVHVADTVTASVELAGGGRMYSSMEHAEVTSGAGVLEARGRVDWWAAPHLTFGASLGTSLIARDQTFTVGPRHIYARSMHGSRHVVC